jgi:uncharacterized membrane protein
MMILIYPITTSMFPMFSKMDPRNQRSDLARGFVLAVKYTSLLMIPASVAVMVFSRDLIYLTFGSGYVLAPQYLVLLAALYLLTAISYLVIGSFLSGIADTRTVLKMSVVTLAVYLPLSKSRNGCGDFASYRERVVDLYYWTVCNPQDDGCEKNVFAMYSKLDSRVEYVAGSLKSTSVMSSVGPPRMLVT